MCSSDLTVQRLFCVATRRLQGHARAAIQIRRHHFNDARRRKLLIPFDDPHVAVEALGRADELRRGPRVQSVFIHDLDFSLHLSGKIG